MSIRIIDGGVTAATGFTASGIRCGIRKNKTKRDIALIFSEVWAAASAVYTTNNVKILSALSEESKAQILALAEELSAN